MKRLKKVLKVAGKGLLIFILVILLIVAIALAWAFETRSGRNFVAAQVESILEKSVFTGDLHVGEVARIRGRLVLLDVRLDDPNGRPIVQAERAEATYRLRPLLSNTVIIPSIVVEDAVVDARVLEDGSLNLATMIQEPDPNKPPSQGAPWQIELREIEVTRSSASLRDDRNDGARLVTADAIEALVSVQVLPDEGVRIGVQRFESDVATPIDFDDPTRVVVTDTVTSLNEGTIVVDSESLTVGETVLSGLAARVRTGDASPFEYIDVDIPDLVATPEDINPYLGDGIELRGPVTLSASIEGPANAIVVSLPVQGPAGTIAAELTFDLSDPAEPRYRGEVALTRFVPSEWVSVDIDADVSLGMYIRGEGFNPQTMHVGTRLDVGPSRVLGFRVDAAHIVARYDAGDVEVRRLAVWSGAAAVDVAASLDQEGALTASVDIDIPDLAELQPRFPDTVPAMEGSVDVTAEARGEIPLQALIDEGPPASIEGWMQTFSGITADVSVALDDFVGFDARVDRARVNADLESGETLPEGTVDIEVRGVAVAGVDLDRADVDASFDGERLSARGDASLSNGAQTARFDLAGRLRNDVLTVDLRSFSGQASGNEVALTEPTRVTIQLDDEMAPTRITIADTTVRAVGADVALSGSFRPPSGAVDARVVALNLNLQELGERFAPDLSLQGFANVRADLGGRLSAPTANVQAEAVGVSAMGVGAHEFDVDLALDQALTGTIMLSRRGAPVGTVYLGPDGIPLDVNLERGLVALNERRPMSLDMTIERLKLGTLGPLLPEEVQLATRGYLAIDLGARGTFDAPDVIASVRLADATVELPLEQGDWTIRNAHVDVNMRATGDGDDWSITGTADGALGNREIFDIELDTAVALSTLRDAPMDALMNLDLQTDGTLHEVTVEDIPEWLREQLDLRSGAVGGAVNWNGSLQTGRGTADVFVRDVGFQSFEPVSARVRVQSGESVEVDGLAYYGDDAPSIPREGDLPEPAPGVPGLSLDMNVGTQLAALMGEGVAPVDAPLEMRILIPSTAVSEFSSISETLAEQSGTVGGYIDVYGTAGTPSAHGRIALRDVALLGGGQGNAALAVRYEDGEAGLEAFVCDGEDTGLSLTAVTEMDLGVNALRAGLPPVAEWPIEGRLLAETVAVETVVPSLLVASLVDALEGVIEADVRIAGQLGQPRIEGHLMLDEVRIGVIPLARTFESVSMVLEMSESAVELVELDVNDERGRVEGAGSVTLDSFVPQAFELTLDTRDFLVSTPSGLGAFIGGEIESQGTFGDNGLDAQVILRDPVVEVPDDVGGAGGGPQSLPSWVYFEGETVVVDERGARDPRLIAEELAAATGGPFRAQIDVQTEGRGVVQHSVGDVYFAVDLNVDLGEELRIGGAVTIPRGTLRVAGKDFTLQPGRIAFNQGLSTIDPTVDIEAVHELTPTVTDYLSQRGMTPSEELASISVVVRGSLSELSRDPENAVQLVSDPRGLTENDMFQLLATGQLSGDTGDEQQGVAAIGSLLLGLVGDSLSDGVPIDTLRIESSGESQRVEGGKYIADNLYVSGTYIRSPDDEDDNNFEVSLEWVLRQIGPGSLRLELRGGDQAKGGLELLYNIITRHRTPGEGGDD